jgi:hypothetical protein
MLAATESIRFFTLLTDFEFSSPIVFNASRNAAKAPDTKRDSSKRQV